MKTQLFVERTIRFLGQSILTDPLLPNLVGCKDQHLDQEEHYRGPLGQLL